MSNSPSSSISPKKFSPSKLKSPTKIYDVPETDRECINPCEVSMANLLDISPASLVAQLEEQSENTKELLKFKYSRRDNLAVNFGNLKKATIQNYRILIEDPKQAFPREYYLGPDCKFT